MVNNVVNNIINNMESKVFTDFILKTAGAESITKIRTQNKIKYYNVVFKLSQVNSKTLEVFEELWPYSTVTLSNKTAIIEFMVRPEETPDFVKAINKTILLGAEKVG